MMETVKSEEYDNLDLTKNKSTTITAIASEEPYICIASNVPGSGVKEYKTIIYLTQSVDTATELVTYPNNMNSSDNPHHNLFISKYKIEKVEHLNTQVKFAMGMFISPFS